MLINRILIIDDDDEDRQNIVQAIEEILPDSHVDEARNGREGLVKLSNLNPQPDLILLDLNMPLMNGFEFLREMKQDGRFADIPVIVMSTSSNPATQTVLSKLGEFPYIIKPDTERELVSSLRDAFDFLTGKNLLQQQRFPHQAI